MYEGHAVRSHVVESHKSAIAAYSSPGTWLDSQTRTAILKERRAASQCTLCQARNSALSPYAAQGEHDTVTALPADLIELVHRLATDSGRLTKRWFDSLIVDGMQPEVYVETVGLVATSLIIDSFAGALSCEAAEPGEPQSGVPSQVKNPGVIEDGAWVPLLDVPQEPSEVELPTAPNIFRAMGLVPAAIEHFFSVMRAQYSLTAVDISLSRSQVELIAARVSALNQCFY